MVILHRNLSQLQEILTSEKVNELRQHAMRTPKKKEGN